jgi:hypothetical protein
MIVINKLYKSNITIQRNNDDDNNTIVIKHIIKNDVKFFELHPTYYRNNHNDTINIDIFEFKINKKQPIVFNRKTMITLSDLEQDKLNELINKYNMNTDNFIELLRYNKRYLDKLLYI